MYRAYTDNYTGFFIEFRTKARSRGQLLGKFYHKNSASEDAVVPVRNQKDPMFPTKLSYVMDVDFEDAGGDSTAFHGDKETVQRFWTAWKKAEMLREEARDRWEMQSIQ
ncbi:hypothetical protein MY5147_006695 [Beauveria neobassiana]